MEKKKWEKPKLVVLVRGKPEEAVLATCKVNEITATAITVCTGINGCFDATST